MNEASMSDGSERQALAEYLAAFNLRVAQPDDPPVFTREPKSSMKPCHWRAADISELLKQIGATLKLEAGGQRRTLRLTNPGLPFGTTPTFWASIQYILPGEVATAHRHMASALRFIMQGHGAETTVDGELYEFNVGDFVLTPSWTWHDHEHKGDAPMVWLDVLDISLVRSLHAGFFEPSSLAREAVSALPDRSYRQFGSGIMRPPNATHSGLTSPLLVYPRERAEEAIHLAAKLEPDPFDDIALAYINPVTGGSALPTLGTMLQMLRPGVQTKPHRHTGSAVYYVIRGEGTTVIDGIAIEWGEGDFFALPPWAVHEHHNRSTSHEALMFQVNDIPVLQKLGFYREQVV